jgi:homoserine dehydrogenase
MVKDRSGIIANLATVLSEYGIYIDAVLQKPNCQKSQLPFLITLEECKASLVEKALERIDLLDFMVQPCLHLPFL